MEETPKNVSDQKIIRSPLSLRTLAYLAEVAYNVPMHEKYIVLDTAGHASRDIKHELANRVSTIIMNEWVKVARKEPEDTTFWEFDGTFVVRSTQAPIFYEGSALEISNWQNKHGSIQSDILTPHWIIKAHCKYNLNLISLENKKDVSLDSIALPSSLIFKQPEIRRNSALIQLAYILIIERVRRLLSEGHPDYNTAAQELEKQQKDVSAFFPSVLQDRYSLNVIISEFQVTSKVTEK